MTDTPNSACGEPANTLSDPRETSFVYKKSPVKAIREYCVECMGGSRYDVKDCASAGCHLYPFRMGTNVFHRRAAAQKRLDTGNSPGFSISDAS